MHVIEQLCEIELIVYHPCNVTFMYYLVGVEGKIMIICEGFELFSVKRLYRLGK